ncbi:hypothetical protein K2X33_14975 [bacterium]|nr:hypothetical protein [bacterium]
MSGRKYLTAIVSILLLAHPGWALNYAGLAKTIRDNKVRSIDDLLPLLPEDYRKYYTLVYHSRSLQAGAVSPEWPRIILYGADAKFLMAFTKNPKTEPVSQLEDALETIEFIDARSVFQLRRIVFAPGRDPLATEPEINPVQCTRCHGTDPRPNWDPYNFWPGVYGSVSRDGCSTMQEGSQELKNYVAFLTGNRKRDRYQFLPPEMVGQRNNSGCPQTLDHDYTFSNAVRTDPNAHLTSLLFRLNSRRIRRLITASPSFPTFKYLWAGLAKNCRNDVEEFFPLHYAADNKFTDLGATRQALKHSSRRGYTRRLRVFQTSNTGSLTDPNRSPLNFLDDEEPLVGQASQLESAARIQFVARRAGVSTWRWETGFSDSRGDFTTPDGATLDMFRNWAVPGTGNMDCDQLAGKSVEALSKRR